MSFNLLDLLDPLKLRNIAKGKAPDPKGLLDPGNLRGMIKKVRIPALYMQPWTMAAWDRAYDALIRGGSNDTEALKEIASIRLASDAGNAQAQMAKRNLDAVAKLVLKGLPKPSTFVAQRRRQSPLLPGGRGAADQFRQQQRSKIIQRQKMELDKLKRERAEQAKLQGIKRRVQARFSAEREAHDVEMANAEAELEMLRKQLERRDLADEVRAKLEAQAEQYEALIDKLQSGGPSAEAASTSESMAAEQVEAEQDDAADAYPSGVPGDTEFNDAGA